MHSAQIRLVYEDLTTTRPSRVHIRFRRNYEVQEDADLWREQRPVWTRILQSENNLVEAFTKIAKLIKE
ncbi:hypothetical protein BG000_000116 [Podila horticola]|nr:hypothetical protein BG000_000116 [Podila horticola]